MMSDDVKVRLNKANRMMQAIVRLDDPNEGTRIGALSAYRSMLQTEGIDPREMRLSYITDAEKAEYEEIRRRNERDIAGMHIPTVEENLKQRKQYIIALTKKDTTHKEKLAEYDGMMKELVAVLETRDSTIAERDEMISGMKKQIGSIPKLEKAIADLENDWKAMDADLKKADRRWAKALEDSPFVNSLKAALVREAGTRDSAVMLREEMMERLEEAFPNNVIRQLADMGFPDGPPHPIPQWLRVYLRGMKPPPNVKPRKARKKSDETPN